MGVMGVWYIYVCVYICIYTYMHICMYVDGDAPERGLSEQDRDSNESVMIVMGVCQHI